MWIRDKAQILYEIFLVRYRIRWVTEFERWNKCYHNLLDSSHTFSDADNVVPTKRQNLLWTRSWQWDTEEQGHLEDGLKFGLSAWINFQAGKLHNTAEMWDFPMFPQRSCVCSCSSGLSGRSGNVPAHLSSKKMQCWVLNPEMICAFLQRWSLQTLPADPTNLSSPGIEQKLIRHEVYQLQKKSYQTVDTRT